MDDYRDLDDYKLGLEVFDNKYEQSHKKMLDNLYEFSPKLAYLIVGQGLGDIWGRKTAGLTVKEKELAVLSSLITAGTVDGEIKAHAQNLLNVGATKDEIKDLLCLLILYIGAPKIVKASQLIDEALRNMMKII